MTRKKRDLVEVNPFGTEVELFENWEGEAVDGAYATGSWVEEVRTCGVSNVLVKLEGAHGFF